MRKAQKTPRASGSLQVAAGKRSIYELILWLDFLFGIFIYVCVHALVGGHVRLTYVKSSVSITFIHLNSNAAIKFHGHVIGGQGCQLVSRENGDFQCVCGK